VSRRQSPPSTTQHPLSAYYTNSSSTAPKTQVTQPQPVDLNPHSPLLPSFNGSFHTGLGGGSNSNASRRKCACNGEGMEYTYSFPKKQASEMEMKEWVDEGITLPFTFLHSQPPPQHKQQRENVLPSSRGGGDLISPIPSSFLHACADPWGVKV